MPPELSACCGALVTVEGEPGETQFWSCRACKKPCDVMSAAPLPAQARAVADDLFRAAFGKGPSDA